jgi:hypothetical protein
MDAGRMETPFDYFFDDRTNPRTIEALRGGPLASPLEAYARRLHTVGLENRFGRLKIQIAPEASGEHTSMDHARRAPDHPDRLGDVG